MTIWKISSTPCVKNCLTWLNLKGGDTVRSITIAEYDLSDFIKRLRNSISLNEPISELSHLNKDEIRTLYYGMLSCAAAKGLGPQDLN